MKGHNLPTRPSPQHSKPSKDGFADVARWISLDRDNETFIFRKFDELAARNLLYLQAELLVIENKLNKLDQRDALSDDIDVKDVARRWEALEQLNNVDAQARLDLVIALREKLKEYQEALLRQKDVAHLEQPKDRVLNAYRHWFKLPRPALLGFSKTFLDDTGDLVALKSSPESDQLSILLRSHWPVKEEVSHDGYVRIGRYCEKSISVTVAVITVIVAAFLLVGSILGLYFVTSDAARLGMVAGFTATFALSISVMTNARRPEIFGATAAYAAVLVVFISGDLSNAPSTSGT
ncbi:hypothetical protein CC79DRAFT_1362613 [Sarocladium strictum]